MGYTTGVMIEEKMEGNKSDLQQVEECISQLMESGQATHAVQYLRQLIESYEARKQALLSEIERLKLRHDSTEDTLRSLRVVLTLTEGGQAKASNEFADTALNTWECAVRVLERREDWLTADEIAAAIERAGKPLGDQRAATVTNALRRHLNKVFVRKKDGRKYLYGLKKWEDSNAQLELEG